MVGSDLAGMVEAQNREDQREPGTGKSRDGGIPGDVAHLPEGVSIQQQPARRLPPEHQLYFGGELRIVRPDQSLPRQLGVALATANSLQVVGDVVVSVDLRLITGGELLPAYWRTASNSGAASSGLSLAGK